MAVNYIPKGYQHVIPYLLVKDCPALIKFLEAVFDGKLWEAHKMDNGAIMHAEVQIKDCVVMMSEATDQHPARKIALCVYVPDVDATYKAALKAGAKSERAPENQFYGDRSAGVTDPFGNTWWLNTHVEDVSPQELQKRMAAQKPK